MNRILLCVVAALFFVVSCASVSVTTPPGFAHFDKEKFYKAVSADGVYISGYTVEDKGSEQNSDLATWVAEIDRSLTARGYTAVGKSDLNPDGGDGRYCEYEVIFNGELYVYAVLLAINGDRLFTVEAGGKKARFLAKKDSILSAMKTAKIQ